MKKFKETKTYKSQNKWCVYDAIRKKLTGYTYQPNNNKTRKSVRYNLINFLQRIRDKEKINGFLVICDSSNNAHLDEIKGLMNVNVQITEKNGHKKDKHYVVAPCSKSK